MGALARMPAERVVPLLLQALTSPEAQVRVRAAETLGLLRDPGDRDRAHRPLQGPARDGAARRHQGPGRDRARGRARPAARRPPRREQPRAPAGRALAGQAPGPEQAATDLLPLLDDPDPQDALRDPARAGADPQPARSVPRITPSSPTRARSCASRPWRRWAAIRAVAAVRPLVDVLATPTATSAARPRRPWARSAIRRRCPRCSSPSRTSTGASAARPPPRSAASAASRPSPPLLARLDDDDATVRRAVVAALGEIGDARAAAPPDPAPVRSRPAAVGPGGAAADGAVRAARAGARLRGRGAGRAAPASWTSWASSRTARDARLLLAALADDSAQVRAEAALALGDGGFLDAVRPLMDLKASDPSAEVRQAAAMALTKLTPR